MSSSSSASGPSSPKAAISAASENSRQLAIDGGAPLFPAGLPDWPQQTEAIRDALLSAFSERRWGKYQAAAQETLCQRLAEMTQTQFAWLCSSGTIAVELALRSLRVQPGDEVILAGYDFPGNFRAVEAVGAHPVLVDIDATNWCLSPASLQGAASAQTKALIVSHLHGGLAPMPSLVEWGREQGIAIVEDACQSPGAVLAGKPVGAWGDVGVFSFGGSKLLSAGRGGALVTSREDIWQRIKVTAERGNDAFPLSELQASVLLPQIESLPELNQQRLAAATQLRSLQQRLPSVRCGPQIGEEDREAFYKFPLLLPPTDELPPRCREQIAAAARTEGFVLEPGFRGFTKRSSRRCRKVGSLTAAHEAAERTLLLHHPVLLSDSERLRAVQNTLYAFLTRWL